jgi:MFS family permease
MVKLAKLQILHMLTSDGRLLFTTRIARLFGYGFISVVLVLYLVQVGLTESQIGLLLSLTLIGDAVISLWLTTNADRIGRRRMLIIGAFLMVFAGVLFAMTRNLLFLLIAATIGVISPNGNEVGPFLSIEQAALSQIIPDGKRTHVFAWYNLVGFFGSALGALSGGTLVQALQHSGVTPIRSYITIVVGYALIGALLGGLFMRLSPSVEAPEGDNPLYSTSGIKTRFGLHRSRRIVFKFAAINSLDSIGGGFVLQSVLAYWFHVHFNAQPALLGSIFFGTHILAGISSLAAARIASRIGLINTMVFTHLPSHIFLILVPLMPNLPLAITCFLMRSIISSMDVPTRQSYTMAVVSPDERSAAAGITGITRTFGTSISPVFTGLLLANPVFASVPFFLAGGFKIVYDLMLYRSFRSIRPPEEKEADTRT